MRTEYLFLIGYSYNNKVLIICFGFMNIDYPEVSDMKKQFKKIFAAILASAAAVSVFSAGASALTVQDSMTAPVPEGTSSQTAPAADEADQKVGVIPSKMYKYRIHDVNDYITAVKSTMSDKKDISDAVSAVKNYVPSVDNMKSKYFPEVGIQVGGTCCAWGNVYYQLTYQVNKKLDRAASSETNMQPVFVYNLARAIAGGIMPDTCMEIVAHAGCATFSKAPDKSDLNNWHADYDTWLEANQYRISSYMYYDNVGSQNSRITSPTDPDLEAIKATIRNGDLICFSTHNGHRYIKIGDAPGVPKELVGKYVVAENYYLDSAHEMTIVGYDDNVWSDINGNGKVDDGELGAFKVVDNYGANETNDGCHWYSYDSLNTMSSVKGAANHENRLTSMYDFIKLNLDKAWKPSNIFLKYTVSTANRADNYVEVTAERKSDGMRYTSKTAPYCTIKEPYTKAALNGKAGRDDGTMIFDLDNIIPDLNTDNFHDYNWSVKFADSGSDGEAFTVKEAVIIDNNTGKSYALDTAVPFDVNKSEKTVNVKNYYHIAKIYTPAASELRVGNKLSFTFKTANETFGTAPVKYTFTVTDTKDGKEVFSKTHKATTVYKDKNCSVVRAAWVPQKAGIYNVTIKSTDASGAEAVRSAEIKVYNKMLAVREITIDKGTTVSSYDKIKITPLVVGGKAPYKYSYYYIRNGKTYTIAENTKYSSKTKQLGSESGSFKILVKVTDADGKTAQASQSFTAVKTRVTRFIYNKDKINKNQNLYIKCTVRNLPECVKTNEFIYTAEKDGKIETLQYKDQNWPDQVVWTPAEDGVYTITVTIKHDGKVLAEKKDTYQVGSPETSEVDGMRRINVFVISYVSNSTNSSNYQLRYWGGKTGAKDAKCSDSQQIKTKNVGFWSSSQTFRQFTAYIPIDSTGFKFHIGDRWFGTDGSVSAHNSVYVFNYDYDRCLYTKE